MKIQRKMFAIVSGTILLVAAFIIYAKGFPKLDTDAIRLSAIVLVGLALTVVFMAILVIIYSVLGVENKNQALGLPEGSVRALLAFSLVLVFVCLAAFLFSEVNKPCENCAKSLERVPEAQLGDLKSNFIVAVQQATNKDGSLAYEQIPPPGDTTGKQPINDLKHPLYSVTYYPKQNADAADFAKQIFTTLATIFVSVVSFYFGSSVTTSAVGAGARAAQGTDGEKKSALLQTALTGALADSHNAQVALDRASENLKKAQSDLAAAPDDAQKQAAVQAAQKVKDDAKTDLQDKQIKVQSAQDAVNDAKTKGTDSKAGGSSA